MVLLEDEKSAHSHAASLTRPMPRDLEQLEAVITGKIDIDAVNGSKMADYVSSFFVREEFLWAARSISPLGPHQALRLEGPAAVAAKIREVIDQMLAGLRVGQGLTFRLLDLRSDEADALGAELDSSFSEANPELGLHGARWILRDAAYQETARRLAISLDRNRVTLAIPFVNDELELDEIFNKLQVPNPSAWGVFVETPAAVDRLPHMLDRGLSVVNVGTKDLVQFTLAADRNGRSVAHIYDTRHPSVMNALANIVKHCVGYNVLLRIFVLGSDLQYYRSYLPASTRFMMCTRELLELSPAT